MGEWGDYDDTKEERIRGREIKLPPQQHHYQQQEPSKTELIFLEYEWVLWYDEGSPKGQSHADYENSMKLLGSFATVQDFWRYWNNIVDISKFPDFSNLRMFKTGIKPMWEDKANIDGGKWVVQCSNKDHTNNLTLKIVLAIIGEQLEHGEDICGMVLSVRPKGDTINIWNRCGNDHTIINTTTAQLVQLTDTAVKYQAHREAITYNKSFHAKSPKNNHANANQLNQALRSSADNIVYDPNLPQMANGVPNISLSTGAVHRVHPTHKGLPYLDLDGVPNIPAISKGKYEVELVAVPGLDKEQHNDNKNKGGLDNGKDYWAEEKALQSQSQFHHRRHKVKQHKKSKSMSVVEAHNSQPYPIAGLLPNHVRRLDVPPNTLILPPMSSPIPSASLAVPTSLVLSNNTSFRKQHRKSASVSVESSAHSHSRTHSRTPSSDATRKNISKSPLLNSTNFLSSSTNFLHTSSPRAFVPVARRPSVNKEDTDKDRKKKTRGVGRKDIQKPHNGVSTKKSPKAFVSVKTFFLEHLPLLAMILGICLITVVLQQW